jgi:hypothetical protein
MTHGEPFDELRLRHEAVEERHHRLTELGHQWNHVVRNELQRLAQALWPSDHALGLFPAHRVRLRHQVEEEAWVWWIERDIPPYDLYRCEAYRVTLIVDAGDEPVLTVESGAGVYQVAPFTAAALEAVLVQAAENPPLVIPRAMGEVVD